MDFLFNDLFLQHNHQQGDAYRKNVQKPKQTKALALKVKIKANMF